jgi:hypothetical protein
MKNREMYKNSISVKNERKSRRSSHDNAVSSVRYKPHGKKESRSGSRSKHYDEYEIKDF